METNKLLIKGQNKENVKLILSLSKNKYKIFVGLLDKARLLQLHVAQNETGKQPHI